MKNILRGLSAMIVGVGLAACASAPPPPPPPPPPPFPMTRSEGTWTFDYDAQDRVATAQLRSGQGALLVEMSCQAPRGPLEVRDWTFATLSTGGASLGFELGEGEVRVPGQSPASPVGSGGVHFAVSPMDLAVTSLLTGQRVAVLGPDNGHDWGSAAADQVLAVANACVQRGS